MITSVRMVGTGGAVGAVRCKARHYWDVAAELKFRNYPGHSRRHRPLAFQRLVLHPCAT